MEADMSEITETFQDQSPQDRLDSWKEIGTYLRRSVRTVMRWEKEEGLPVTATSTVSRDRSTPSRRSSTSGGPSRMTTRGP